MQAETIKDLSDEEARDLFERMGVEYYGKQTFRPSFARDADVTAQAVHTWAHKRPATWAILLLDAWQRNKVEAEERATIARAFELMQALPKAE